MEKDMRQKMEDELAALAMKYSATRIKISTVHFDRDYQRDDDGGLRLVSEKAIIRVLGKVTKVPIGEGEKFATYEEAFEATKNHWQEYYKKVRAKRSEKSKATAARKQKRYRAKVSEKETALKRQQ